MIDAKTKAILNLVENHLKVYPKTSEQEAALLSVKSYDAALKEAEKEISEKLWAYTSDVQGNKYAVRIEDIIEVFNRLRGKREIEFG